MIKIAAFIAVAIYTVQAASDVNSWQVTDPQTGYVCLLLKGTFQFAIQYENKTGQIVERNITVPQVNETDVTGNCSSKYNSISVPFLHSANHSWQMNMTFSSKKDTFSLTDIALIFYMDEEQFPDVKEDEIGKEVEQWNADLDKWTTKINSSYQCNSQEQITNFTRNSTLPDVVHLIGLNVANEQLQAFRRTNDTKFDNAVSCPADVDQISNIVPIIVGAALAAFVLIVLIAYLIGRRRSKSGYESV